MMVWCLMFLLVCVARGEDIREELGKLELALQLADVPAPQQKKSIESMSEEEILNELLGTEKKSAEIDLQMADEDLWKATLEALDSEEKRKVADEPQKKSLGMTNECKNNFGDSYCDSNKMYCSLSEKMKTHCMKTCGACNQLKCTGDRSFCKYVSERQCVEDTRAKKVCPVRCGACRAQAPPKCSQSEHGCCWDKNTAKDDAKGSNCPGCDDQYESMCKVFKQDCEDYGKRGELMRNLCPKTCQLCEKQCKDDPKKAFYCKFWKKDLDWCNKKEDTMRWLCPKTCNFC